MGCCQRLNAVSTRFGRLSLSLRTVASLKARHSLYFFFFSRLRTRMSVKGHETLTYVSSRQPRSSATRRSAGNQCEACESPTRATVNLEPGLPKTQDLGQTAASSWRQPFVLRNSKSSGAFQTLGWTSLGRRTTGVGLGVFLPWASGVGVGLGVGVFLPWASAWAWAWASSLPWASASVWAWAWASSRPSASRGRPGPR